MLSTALLTAPQPYDFWRDSIWQFVGVVVAVLIGIVAAVLAFMSYRKTKQQGQKEITYGMIADTPILSINEEVKSKVQVLYNGKPISDAHMVTIKIWNTGYVPIIPNDYFEPIKLGFGASSEVLDVEILETTPPNIKVSINRGVENFSLEPFLLNSKEAVVVKVLLANFKGNITVEARIVGTQQVLDTNVAVDSSNQSLTTTASFTAIKLAIGTASAVIPLLGPLAGEITSVALDKYFNKPKRRRVLISDSKEPLLLNTRTAYTDKSNNMQLGVKTEGEQNHS